MSLLTTILLPLFAVPTAGSSAIPAVVLSAQHQKMCRVGVGDAMPDLSLTDLKKQTQSLAKQFGQRATVVAFIGKPNWMNRSLLTDLPRDVAAAYADRGVATVVVTVDRPATAKEVSDSYLLVTDPTGQQFAKLGNGKLPRVYVLNADGQIVWFDIEYSRSTRRELKQTLAAMLTEKE